MFWQIHHWNRKTHDSQAMKPVFRKNEPFARISRTNLSENLDFSRIFSRFELAPSINKRLYTSLHLTDYDKIIYQNDPRETGFLNMYNFSMKNFIRLNGWGLNMTQIFFRVIFFAIPKYASFSEGVYYFSEKPKYVKKYTVVILMIRAIFLWKPFLEITSYGEKVGENPRVFPFWIHKLTPTKTNMSSYHFNESKLNSVKSSHGQMKDALSIPTKMNLIIAN